MTRIKFYLTILTIAFFAISCNNKGGEEEIIFDKPTISVRLAKGSPKANARFGFTDGKDNEGNQGIKVKWDKDDVLMGWNSDGTRAIFKLISGAGSYSGVFQHEGEEDEIKDKELELFAMTRDMANALKSGSDKPATFLQDSYIQGKSGTWNGESINKDIVTTIDDVYMELSSKSVLKTKNGVTVKYDGKNNNLTKDKEVAFTTDYAVMILVLDGNLSTNQSFEGESTISGIELTLGKDDNAIYSCRVNLAESITLSGPSGSGSETTDAVVYLPVPENSDDSKYNQLGITIYRSDLNSISVTKPSTKNTYKAGAFYHRILLNSEDPVIPPTTDGWILIESDWYIPGGGSGIWN